MALEDLAYGLSRGFWRAYFDVQAERAEAEEEVADEEDHDRADRMRAAVGFVQDAPRDPGSENPPPRRGRG